MNPYAHTHDPETVDYCNACYWESGRREGAAAERAACVAWLRDPSRALGWRGRELADAIARGEHREKTSARNDGADPPSAAAVDLKPSRGGDADVTAAPARVECPHCRYKDDAFAKHEASCSAEISRLREALKIAIAALDDADVLEKQIGGEGRSSDAIETLHGLVPDLFADEKGDGGT